MTFFSPKFHVGVNTLRRFDRFSAVRDSSKTTGQISWFEPSSGGGDKSDAL